MTVTALGMVARRGGRNPGGAGREPFLRTRRWHQLCSPPSPPASLSAELRLVLGDGGLPGAPSSCGWVSPVPSRDGHTAPRPTQLQGGCVWGAPGAGPGVLKEDRRTPPPPRPSPRWPAGPGSTATCSPPAGRGAALQRVPGQPVGQPGRHRGHVRREPEAGRVHRSALLGHQASVWADGQGGSPSAGVPDAGRASAGVSPLSFRPCANTPLLSGLCSWVTGG